jgi:pimeloyl-ACP methyl ester carboxylesterase
MLVVLGLPKAAGSAAAAQKVENVILLHGWYGDAESWDTAKAQYEAAGFKVFALSLPREGTQMGDTLVNARYVEDFISSHHLTNVQVDGHSLGGFVVYELVRVIRDPAIVSAITRDSAIQDWTGDFGPICSDWLTRLLGSTIIPDQCEGSLVRNLILQSAPADVPVLNISSRLTSQDDVGCHRSYFIFHTDFLSDRRVTADAILWAEGINPCTTGPASSADCVWWQRLLHFCP